MRKRDVVKSVMGPVGRRIISGCPEAKANTILCSYDKSKSQCAVGRGASFAALSQLNRQRSLPPITCVPRDPLGQKVLDDTHLP